MLNLGIEWKRMIFIVPGIVQKTRTVKRKNKEKRENFDA